MAGVFAALASVVSGIFAAALWRRWNATRRNHALLIWSLSLAMFFLASLALAEGALDGWGEGTFRTFYLFGAVLNVPWLALGSVQLNADDRTVSRAVGAVVGGVGVLTLIPAVVSGGPSRAVFLIGGGTAVVWGALHWRLSGDALRIASLVLVAGFTGAALAAVPVAPLAGSVLVALGEIPEGRALLPSVPRGLAFGGNTAGSLIVIVGAGVSAWKQRRVRRSLAVGNLLIGLGVAIAGAGGAFSFLGASVGNAVGIGIGVSVMYAGFVATTRTASTDATTVAAGGGGNANHERGDR